jgi:hypothetical protein
MWSDATKKRKLKKQKSKTKKKKNAKSQKQKFSRNVKLGKSDCGGKDVASLPRDAVEEVRRTSYKNRGQLPNLGRSPLHLPVDASSLHEEIEPLVARRTPL